MPLLCPAQQALLRMLPSRASTTWTRRCLRPDMCGTRCVCRKTEMFRFYVSNDVHTLRTPPTAHCDRRSEVTKRPTYSGRQASRDAVEGCQPRTPPCHGTRAVAETNPFPGSAPTPDPMIRPLSVQRFPWSPDVVAPSMLVNGNGVAIRSATPTVR